MKIYGRKKESLVESTFANLGQATLQTDEKRSRKEIKKEVREEHSSEGRKNVIEEKLALLRKNLLITGKYNDAAKKVEDIHFKLKRISEGHNATIKEILDNFIYNEIISCENYFNRENYIALECSLGVITDLINERLTCAAYFEDETYVTTLILKNQALLERENLYAQIDNKKAQCNKWIEEYNDPTCRNKQTLYEHILENKKDRELLHDNVEKLTTTIESYENTLVATRAKITIYNDDKFNTQEKLVTGGLETAAENEAKNAEIKQLNSEFDNNKSTAKANNTTVNENIVSNNSNKQELPKVLELED